MQQFNFPMQQFKIGEDGIKKFRKRWLTIVISLLCILLMGCRSNSTGTADLTLTNPAPVFTPLVIKSGMENGHPAGIRLSIQTTVNTDTTTAYKLISSYEGKPVGLIVVVPRKDNGKKTGNRAFFKSLGLPSDLFLHILASQYKQHVDSSSKFTDSIPFICMNLMDFYHENSDSARENNWVAAEYKLFFNSESIDGDAEMFMNINPDRQWVEFAEKDEDYRPHLISLFKQH